MVQEGEYSFYSQVKYKKFREERMALTFLEYFSFTERLTGVMNGYVLIAHTA
jgi:hypothetical protein